MNKFREKIMKNQLPALKITVVAALLVSSVLLHGCAVSHDISSLSAQQLQRLSDLEVLQGAPSRPYSVIDIVRVLSCSGGEEGMEEAVIDAKVVAVQLDADAVIDLHCQAQSDIRIDGCASPLVCAGTAVEYTR